MPGFISQIISFFQTALTWVAVLAIPTAGVMVTYHAIMRSTAVDEMTAMHHSRAIRNSVIYGAIAILGGGIVSAILGAFH